MAREQELVSRDAAERVETGESHVLVLCNDEVNTFEYVIKSLVDVCSHDHLQAEQCAMITHFNGKCDVKCGEFDYLLKLKRGLIDRGLTAVVERN